MGEHLRYPYKLYPEVHSYQKKIHNALRNFITTILLRTPHECLSTSHCCLCGISLTDSDQLLLFQYEASLIIRAELLTNAQAFDSVPTHQGGCASCLATVRTLDQKKLPKPPKIPPWAAVHAAFIPPLHSPEQGTQPQMLRCRLP
jgi:hypothetical protein